MELIRKQMLELKGKKIIVFLKYAHINYPIKKSGTLLDCDDKFFVLDEIKDGKSTYVYDYVVQVMEERV